MKIDNEEIQINKKLDLIIQQNKWIAKSCQLLRRQVGHGITAVEAEYYIKLFGVKLDE